MSEIVKLVISIFSLAFASGLLFSCSSIEQKSEWMKDEITIDGKTDDWGNKLRYFEDEGVMIGLQNDYENIYMAIVTDKKEILGQIIFRGLIVWFDPDGGTDKDYGLRFPIVFNRENMGREEMMQFRNMKDQNLESRFDMIKDKLDQIEIIRSEPEEKYIVDLENADGIEAALDIINESMVYELKIPLKRTTNNMFAAHSDTGKVLGIGLETPEIKRPRMAGGMSGRGGGMSGGMGGSGSMRGGGMGRPAGMSMPEQFSLWIEVTLSAGK